MTASDVPTALIDLPAQPGGAQRLRATFGAARQWLVANTHDEVRAVLDVAEAHSRAGRWCVGYVRYEAAPAFDRALAVHPGEGPLAAFAVFDAASEGWPAETGAALGCAAWADPLEPAHFADDLQRIRTWIA